MPNVVFGLVERAAGGGGCCLFRYTLSPAFQLLTARKTEVSLTCESVHAAPPQSAVGRGH
jgi:hypothetical protein